MYRPISRTIYKFQARSYRSSRISKSTEPSPPQPQPQPPQNQSSVVAGIQWVLKEVGI